MALNMNLRDLSSPQQTAGTGRKRKSPYTAYLTGLAPSVRENARQETLDALQEKEYLQGVEQFNATTALNREQMDIAVDQNKKASAIGTVQTGISAAAMADKAGLINLKDLGTKTFSQIWPETTGGGAVPPIVDAGTSLQMTSEFGAADAGLTAAESSEVAGLGASTSGISATGAAGASLSSIASYALPWVAAAKIGMPIFGKVMGQGFRDAFGIDPAGSNTIAQLNRAAGRGVEGAVVPLIEEVGGVDLPDIAEFAINPPGYLLSKCIIVTACTSADSPEVDITREYRDRFLTPEQLRGYYAIATPVTKMMYKYPTFTKFIKKHLVDHLISYGRSVLSETERLPTMTDRAVTAVFLLLCKVAGILIPSYTRENGEVY